MERNYTVVSGKSDYFGVDIYLNNTRKIFVSKRYDSVFHIYYIDNEKNSVQISFPVENESQAIALGIQYLEQNKENLT